MPQPPPAHVVMSRKLTNSELRKHLEPKRIEEDKDALAKVELIGAGKTESELKAILKKREARPGSTA